MDHHMPSVSAFWGARRGAGALMLVFALTTIGSAADKASPQEGPVRAKIAAELPALKELYEQLHAHPELSNEEE
jgi:hypothetical protein